MHMKRRAKINWWSIVHSLRNVEGSGRYSKVATDGWWPALVAAIANSHLQTVVALLLIVMLLMLNFILRFPDLGAVIAEYNQF